MNKATYGRYKYLGLFAALSVTLLLVSNFTAARIVSFANVGMPVTVLYFPLTYLIADVLTEVYGYAQARNVIWLSLFCNVVAALILTLALLVPPASFFKDDAAFQLVFSSASRIALAGLVAVFTGDICNCYVLAKMKVWNKGAHLWLRFVISTVVGEGVNTIIFFMLALYGTMPTPALVESVLAGWMVKSLVEIIMLPVTYPVVRYLKKAEGVDYYDNNTNFNPFARLSPEK